MTSLNNCHTLFTGTIQPTFIDELTISRKKDQQLKGVRDEIIAAIRSGFKQAAVDLAASVHAKEYEIPTPFFATQGSYVYKTINKPAYPPKQQLDLDLGVYLPFSALNDGHQPSQTAKTYFDLIEKIMGTYIERNRRGQWELDEGKRTCVRVIIDRETHIDLPLYGAPAKEFNRIKELAALKAESLLKADAAFIDQDRKLDTRCIHMAMRNGKWLNSDPLVMRDWVIGSCNIHGQNNSVRAVARYLKGWRDHQWQNGKGPSSIFLLAHTLKHYDSSDSGHHNYLATVIDRLPEVFDSPLWVPAPSPDDKNAQEDLRLRIDEQDKSEYLKVFENLKYNYHAAINNRVAESANLSLVSIFGERFPYAPERIKQTPPSGGSGPGGVVRSTAATPAAAVFPDATTSG